MSWAEVGDLDRIDRALINAFQGGFPVCEHPFEHAAQALSDHGIEVSGEELVARTKHLDEEGVLTRFGALVNAQRIGGTATLVAMHAPEERFEEVVELVNDHREVAHNYEREHPYLNMWFVLSVAEESRVEEVLAEIEAETGEKTYNLPKKREFRVEAKFMLDGPLSEGEIDLSALGPDVEPTEHTELTPEERDLVLAIQGGFPIVADPYRAIAADLGIGVEWVRETIKRFNEEGKIRRVGIIPNHYALGYTENGMTVWNVPDGLVEEVGPAVASLSFVTHCYERPRHEGVWPYNVFAMTHGRSEAESEQRVRDVRKRMGEFWEVGEGDWDTLFSTRILKKTGIRLAERADANTSGGEGE